MEMTLLTLIFQGIPTAMALSLLILAVNKSLKYWKAGLIFGVMFGVLLFFIRLLPVAFGVHTLIMISLHIVVFRMYFKFNFLPLIKAMLLGILIIVVSEAITLLFLQEILGINIDEISKSNVGWILVGWVGTALLLVLALVINHRT